MELDAQHGAGMHAPAARFTELPATEERLACLEARFGHLDASMPRADQATVPFFPVNPARCWPHPAARPRR